VKTTRDGRKVEVIGRHLCLDGVPETDTVTVLARLRQAAWGKTLVHGAE
jgi:hypothetical protein